MRRLIPWGCLLLICGCGSQNDGTSTATTEAPAAATKPAGDATPAKPEDPVIPVLFTRVDGLLKKGELGKSIEAMSQAIAHDPDCAKAYALRARLHADLNMNANATADFGTAIRLDPANASYYNARGH